MTKSFIIKPQLDLVLAKTTDVKPELLWKAWTDPELLKQWFCPKPWKVTDCQLDLIPGGQFMTLMEGPEGQKVKSHGCFLEIDPGKKLVWTSAMLPGYRPIPKTDGALAFTAVVVIEPNGTGSKYTAIALHKDMADREAHEKMGFNEGWSAAFDQLVELTRRM